MKICTGWAERRLAHILIREINEMSGFWQAFVGFLVGKFDLPDKHCPFGFNALDAICRVCRVL
jgi:hypothetical protein